ncbi:Smr/MutS family protein [Tropicibacter sp. Alg240-R139]|uniref:Smr/MutS family protein n=1 Tax=Tropicibacter sp. Alg240-R139 TaxID=2305991 RepID=UPI0013DF4C4E|nr:Smr/MutS family protein [Tropicibacter sp. Alg240-R139]
MARRRLSKEEVDLWNKVVEKADRLNPDHVEESHATSLPKPRPAKELFEPLPVFSVGERAGGKPARNNLKPSVTQHLSKMPVQMDNKAYGRMKRGKLKPEGRLDLHGMRVDSAHPALTRFILSSQASGKRLVLVITGKGKDRDEPGPIPTPRGVLRNQVPQWLSLPPLSKVVMQVTPAHLSHGGEGAYYVYLRRLR